MSDTIIKLVTSVLSIGWLLLTLTSASLLLPNPEAAIDRLTYGLRIMDSTSLHNLRLRLRILFHVATTYIIILPLAAYLWTIDEVLFGDYQRIQILKPVITISVPRGGTTSFHRTLALDDRFATPTMLELVMPFVCLHKIVYAVDKAAPDLIRQLEGFLKWVNGVTPSVDARHPISLLAPDADDILLGEWHWISVGAVRTFPVADTWQKHYQMDAHSTLQRQRSLLLHQRMCQKVLYNHSDGRGGSTRRLLLRSHLSPCVADFQKLYPDASLVGILRDPVDVLRSFAGLSTEAVLAATGVNMLAPPSSSTLSKKDDNNNGVVGAMSPWPPLFLEMLSDMMQKETDLYCGNTQNNHQGNWGGRCHYVTFPEFKADPIRSLEGLYTKIDLPMTDQFEFAVRDGLKRHETYKARHSYQNPTFEEMKIKKEGYLNMPGVKQYAKLVTRSK